MEQLLRVCVFPFASAECYKNKYIESLLNADSNKAYQTSYLRKEPNSESIQTALFIYLSRRTNIHNMDQIELLFKKFYGYSTLQSYKQQGMTQYDVFIEILNKLSKCFICHRNGRLALKYWESSQEEDFIGPYKGINKIALWNALNRIISTDIIILQYLISNSVGDVECLDGFYSSIMLEDLQLEQILQKGVAETHIHKNAGISFLISWSHLMNFTKRNKGSEYGNDFLTNPYIEQMNLRATVKAMSILRLLFVLFLRNGRERNFKCFLENVVYKDKRITNGKENFFFDEIMKIYEGKLIDIIEEDEFLLKQEWNEIVRMLLPDNIYVQDFEDIADYVFENYGSRKYLDTSGENIFLFHALKYLHGVGKKDSWFQCLFWQYIRIKNQVFEAKVEFNSVYGLDYFQQFYHRSTEMEYSSNKASWKTIIRNQLQNQHLRKLELRCSIPSGKKINQVVKQLKGGMKEFLVAYKEILDDDKLDGDKIPFIGLVFHLIKMKDQDGVDKCWQNYMDNVPQSQKNRELFYRTNQENYVQLIKCLLEVRDNVPGLDRYILGIDAASIENNAEPWVFAKAYQIARDSKTSKMILGRHKVQTLGFTFHVGEDFRHLLTGFRHIDEVITHFGYHAGDRIGHGIALGADVDYWIEHNPVVVMPRGEYLDNLLWIWGLCKSNDNHYEIDISFLEQRILKVAESIFSVIDGITIYILWEIYQDKFGEFEPQEKYHYQPKEFDETCCGSQSENKFFCKYAPNSPDLKSWNSELLHYATHCKCYLERLEEVIQVEVSPKHSGLMKMLQKMLIEKISNQGIVVETNPTSNIAIGEIQDLFHHYIFNLNEISNTKEHNSIIVSINADDPSVFNTNVSNEIAYIFYVLQKQGYSREDALLWIDKIRGYGMNTSFIKDRNISKKELIKEISDIIKKLDECI